MKKIFVPAFVFTLFAAALCCTGAEKVRVKKSEILVASYSWSGNTKAVAQAIAKQTGGKSYAITPVKPYPKDYKQCVSLARKETKSKFKPALKNRISLKNYKVIFVGSPNWCGTIAPPVRTFLSDPALKGKTVFLFITHGSGGKQRCETDAKAILKGSKFMPVLAIPGKTAKQNGEKAVAAFLKKYVSIVK